MKLIEKILETIIEMVTWRILIKVNTPEKCPSENNKNLKSMKTNHELYKIRKILNLFIFNFENIGKCLPQKKSKIFVIIIIIVVALLLFLYCYCILIILLILSIVIKRSKLYYSVCTWTYTVAFCKGKIYNIYYRNNILSFYFNDIFYLILNFHK